MLVLLHHHCMLEGLLGGMSFKFLFILLSVHQTLLMTSVISAAAATPLEVFCCFHIN